ncbi:DNA-directed RNA polymerase subunit L [Methanohalophilus levihalophilus]|uniref:DNA-directed RNA polymerase subunit L n=1 Tax=Methanohalophilus levihalophilus TaxID=1431282 RepID=UPI001AE5946D|nr:DNA-directed RNA polymerase subunit L [Methanohalophilus levihalophilus]MBP2030829.1 DNA-directed RNA polymerase subunit L [Methanohalophilus levihalophilus]
MELKILEKTDNEIRLEIRGESHTLLNLLKSVLLEDEHVEIATYDMKHVTISDPVLFVKTDGEDPIATIRKAASSLNERFDDFMEVFQKALS